MKKIIAMSFLLTAFLVSGAQAQATRTWVSGVGDDANPCSRTAPCKTFEGAISKTANAGEISVLDPGGFGAVTITKSITLNGDGTLAGILNAGVAGVIINPGSTGVVTLRNLSLNGAGSGTFGIRILTAQAVHIENCEIYGNAGPGIRVEDTTGGVSLFVRDTVIRNNTGDGILTASLGGGCAPVLENVRIDQNGGTGLKLGTFTSASVANSQISGNGTGVSLENATSNLDMESTVIVRNGTGIVNGASGASTTRISRCLIANNTTGLTISAGTITGYQNNVIVDNGGGNTVSSSVPQQ